MSYELVTLGDYIDVISGFAFKSKDFQENGVPVIKIKNISTQGVSLDSDSCVSKEFLTTHSKYALNYDDVLIAMTGSHINQWASVVGRVAKVKYHENSLLNQRVGKIVSKDEDQCCLDYVYYFLKQDSVVIELAGIAGGAANQANISPGNIKALKIPFPEVEVQRKIANTLSAYDNLIENNQKQIKLLEEAAQRLYKEWFVDLHFPGYEDTVIVDGVPEGWSKAKVTDFLEIKYGKDHKKLEEGIIPVYGSGGIMRKVKPVLYSGESVLIPRKGSLNNIMYVEGDFWTIDTMFYSIPKQKNVAKYVYLFLKGLDMYSYNIGAAVPSMTVKILDGIELLAPTDSILKNFENVLFPIYNRINVLTALCEGAGQARDRLLPKLMSGELEV